MKRFSLKTITGLYISRIVAQHGRVVDGLRCLFDQILHEGWAWANRQPTTWNDAGAWRHLAHVWWQKSLQAPTHHLRQSWPLTYWEHQYRGWDRTLVPAHSCIFVRRRLQRANLDWVMFDVRSLQSGCCLVDTWGSHLRHHLASR